MAIGFFNSGSIAGALVAPLVIPWMALHWGWRAAFLITGAVGFLWLPLWLAMYRRPGEHPRVSAAELALIRAGASSQPDRPPARWLDLLRRRDVVSLVVARMLADPVWWFYVFWLPEYLRRQRHFSMEEIGMFAWIPFLTAGLGSFAGGAASDALMRRGYDAVFARKAVMAVCALAMLAGIPAVFASSAATALALISVVTMAYSTWATNILALPPDIFPPEVVATVAGMAGTGAAAGGMMFTLITGAAVDHFSYTPVFIAAGLMPLASWSVAAWGVRGAGQGVK
jgi:ACS family hexuronate transporter-like MFS transporter